MLFKERGDDRQNVKAAEHPRRTDDQPSGRLEILARRLAFRIVDLRQDGPRARDMACPRIGQRQPAGGSQDRHRARVMLQLADLARQGRGGHPATARRCRKAARVQRVEQQRHRFDP